MARKTHVRWILAGLGGLGGLGSFLGRGLGAMFVVDFAGDGRRPEKTKTLTWVELDLGSEAVRNRWCDDKNTFS